jgi:hypothetical protein
MEIIVDLDASTAELAAPDDFAHFAVRVAPAAAGAGPAGSGGKDIDRLVAVLASTGVGGVGGTGDVFVRPEAVRALAGVPAGEAWGAGFAKMCEYAVSKGWVDDAGGIQAHVEWPTSEG